jgi:hypothetical protein
MNAKEQIAAVKKLKTVKDVEAVIASEKEGKNRSTVINACEERIGELTTTEKPKEKSKETAASKKSGVSAEKIEEFKRKCHRNIRVANVAPFAKTFFGDNFKSSSVKGFTVTITLDSGDTIEIPAR